MVDGKIVFLPRFTALVGAQTGPATFTTQPLDVSRQGGAQFQVWRGPSSGTVKLFLEESLDGETWVLGPSTPTGYDLNANETRFFSYGFRLRWFRLRVELRYTSVNWPKVTLWAEGLLRGGGSGAWPSAAPATGPVASGRVSPDGLTSGGAGGTAGGEAAPAIPEWYQGLIDRMRQRQQEEIDAFLREAAKGSR